MENRYSIVKFLIPFVLAVLYNETRVCGVEPTHAEKMLAHFRQGRHWDFLWFGKVKDIANIATSSGEESMLQMLSPILGCAYGGNLKWFLLLTLEAVGECDNMRRNNHPNANDCKHTLMETIKRGKFVIFKLTRVLMYVDHEIGQDNMENNQFYQVLRPLDVFLTGQIDIVFNEPVPGGSVVNGLLTSVADSLGTFLHSTCHPRCKTFNIMTITQNYRGHPSFVYAFYVRLLKSYMENINNHMLQIGFHYNEITDTMVFDPNVCAGI